LLLYLAQATTLKTLHVELYFCFSFLFPLLSVVPLTFPMDSFSPYFKLNSFAHFMITVLYLSGLFLVSLSLVSLSASRYPCFFSFVFSSFLCCFSCDINEQLIKDTADVMISSGLAKAGYNFVNCQSMLASLIYFSLSPNKFAHFLFFLLSFPPFLLSSVFSLSVDDCWAESRDKNNRIVAEAKRFPSGMYALGQYIHSKGLKFGLYTDLGSKTCAGRPGSLGYEVIDTLQYAAWSADYIKVWFEAFWLSSAFVSVFLFLLLFTDFPCCVSFALFLSLYSSLIVSLSFTHPLSTRSPPGRQLQRR